MKRSLSNRRAGFTLLEIVVVLAIGAILAAITIGGFGAIREGNRRTSCQTNLTQIYQACRQYAQDYTYLPYSNPQGISYNGVSDAGSGLWLLYAYKTDLGATPPSNGDQLGIYLKNPASLHCPDDYYATDAQLYNSNKSLNLSYNSYQVEDSLTTVYTYDVFQSGAVSAGGAATPARPASAAQLYADPMNSRPVPDDAVITWCRFHRSYDGAGNLKASGHNYDNVLFYDGSVEWIPASQPVTCNGVSKGTLTGAARVPREEADSYNCP